MGRPRRVSEPHSGGGWTTRVADAPPPEVRVGRVCVPVDHENLDRFGWSERTDEGRRRVVRSALRFAAEIGVQVVVPPADTPPDLPEGAVVVSQPPPEAFRSNGDWAADLMKRVARHYLADAREGPRAVESLLLYGLTGRTSADYAGALAQGLGHLRDRAADARRPDGEAVAPCRRGGRRSRRAPRGAPRARRPGRRRVGSAAVGLCVRARADASSYRAGGFAARARCRALGAPAAVSVAVRRHAGRLVRLALGRDAAAFPAVRPGRARGGLQRVARRPGGRRPLGQGGPSRRRRRRAGAGLVGTGPGRAGSLAGPARRSGRVRHARERSGSRVEQAPPEQAAAAAGSRRRRRAGSVPRARLPAPRGRRRSRGPHPRSVRRVRRRREAPRLRTGSARSMRRRRLAGASPPTSSIRFRSGSGARRTGAARCSRRSRSRSRRIRGSTTMRVSIGCSGRTRPRA